MADTKKTINDLSTTQSTLANVNIMVQPKSANNTLEKMDGSLVAAASDVTALQTGITGGTVVAKKAEQDASGNTITTTYETKADASNLNSAINQLDHRVENLEQAKGDYVVQSYKDGSITPGGKGKWCVVEGVEGVSRVENQLIPTLDNFSVYHCTKSVSGGVATISGFAGSDAQLYKNSVAMPIGQTALGAVSIKPSKSTMIRVSIGYANIIAVVTLTANVWNNLSNVMTVSGSAGTEFAIWLNVNGDLSTSDTVEVKSAIYSNLSVYFAGDPSVNVSSLTIADIQRDYPHLLLPSDYGTRIVDWTGNGVRAFSRNLYNKANAVADERWFTTGTISASGTTRSEAIPIKPNTTYYFKNVQSQNVMASIFWLDINGNYISHDEFSGTATSGTKTSPSNAFFVGVNMPNASAEICCVNVSDSRDGEVTDYFVNTLSFPSTTLKSAGSVRDTLELNVEVDGVARRRDTQRVATYSFTGSEGWAWDASGFWYMSGYTERSKFDTVIASNGIFVRIYTNSNIVRVYSVDNPSVTSSTIMNTLFKSGTTMNYALYTEVATLSDPIIDNTLLTEAGGRLSTVQTGTVVDGISDLGFITL